MPELPWVKWYPANWASEPGLRLCEASTRGIWFEALNTMFLQNTGSITGTIEELAALLVCRTSQMQLAVEQLKKWNVADVMANGDSITIACRRTVRQFEIKELRRKSGAAGLAKRWQRSTSTSTSSSSEGVQGEVSLTEEQAVAQCSGVLGIPADFGKYIYEDWASRNGRDAGNVQVEWSRYVKKRWNREQDEWRAGIHKGQKTVPRNTNPTNYFK